MEQQQIRVWQDPSAAILRKVPALADKFPREAMHTPVHTVNERWADERQRTMPAATASTAPKIVD